MSSGSESSVTQTKVETIFEKVRSVSTIEPPIEEWSSLILPEPPDEFKMALFKEGLYSPGSGEICAKYIAMSASSVLRHPYYKYPAVIDPGIVDALFAPEPKKIYPVDGQELYLDICDKMGIIPVKCFYRGLLDKIINMRYYSINPVGVRAMAMALEYNKTVRKLDFTDNFLSVDACFHLGQLLYLNVAIQELILSGCQIQAEGMRQIVAGLTARTLEELDLSKNDIGDVGLEYLSSKIMRGTNIKRLNLSRNNLGVDGAVAFAQAISYNNTITHLDLSWNLLFPAKGINDVLRQLGLSTVLTELNVSWNSLTTTLTLARVVGNPSIKVLDLSNNKIPSGAVKWIAGKLKAAKNLKTLNLANNPLTPADALTLLSTFRERAVKLVELNMGGINVTKSFTEELDYIKSLKYRQNTKVTYGYILNNYTLSLSDMRVIVMKRLDYITASTKKCTLDIALYFLDELKHGESPNIEIRDFMKALKKNSAPIDEGLIEELANAFPGPKTDKGGKTISLNKVVEFIKRLWPERKLPPTPPPVELPPPKPAKGKKK